MLISNQDQWNQFTIHQIDNQSYGRPLSTVFVDPPGQVYDEDTDPTMANLRFLDYRHMRFCYHPIEDKFALISGWKDPSWTNAKVMRGGLDADERDSREQIFGQNVIDIQQKTVPQLLVDEVCILDSKNIFIFVIFFFFNLTLNQAFHPFYMFQVASLLLWSMDEYYYYAVCIFLISVFSIGTTVLETRSVCFYAYPVLYLYRLTW